MKPGAAGQIAASVSAFPADLLLPIRTGLPSELAYLRDGYPQPGWTGHVNFGQLAAFWLQVHDSLRQ